MPKPQLRSDLRANVFLQGDAFHIYLLCAPSYTQSAITISSQRRCVATIEILFAKNCRIYVLGHKNGLRSDLRTSNLIPEHLKLSNFPGGACPRHPTVNDCRAAMFSTSANDVAPQKLCIVRCQVNIGIPKYTHPGCKFSRENRHPNAVNISIRVSIFTVNMGIPL